MGHAVGDADAEPSSVGTEQCWHRQVLASSGVGPSSVGPGSVGQVVLNQVGLAQVDMSRRNAEPQIAPWNDLCAGGRAVCGVQGMCNVP